MVVSWESMHSFDLVGNIIEGGDVPSGLAATALGLKGSVGVSSRTGGYCCPNQSCVCHPEFQMIGNKIYGGDSAAGAPSCGLYLSAFAANFAIANNMIHAGGARQSATGPRTAIDFAQSTSALVGGNTLYAGGTTSNEAVAINVESDQGYAEHQISIDGNVLAGNNQSATGLVFQSGACPNSGVVQALQDNLFLNEEAGAAA
jgi:hypothetical protein